MALRPTEIPPRLNPTPPLARPTPAIPGTGGMASAEPDTGRRLIVGREIQLSGEISACDTLVVEGRVEASLSDSQKLEITETGSFKGDVQIDEAIIAGRFEGNLVARRKLVIRATGRIEGNVRYGDIEIEEGGRIIGQVDVVDSEAAFPPTAEAAPVEERANDHAPQPSLIVDRDPDGR